MASAEVRKPGYLPSLDGFRAVAILSVIFYHDRVHKAGIFSTALVHAYGALGVSLFFAISGILICTRLIEEERVNGSISLKAFYIRRIFRIFPPAIFFLLTYLVLSLIHQLPIDLGGVVTSFLMVRNLWVAVAGDVPRTWYTIHFWSLSVEEHFYLILPGLLILLKNRRAYWLGLLSCVLMLWMTIVFHFRVLQTPAISLRTDVRLDALLIPAAFAVLLRKIEVRAVAIRMLQPALTTLTVFSVFALMQMTHSRLVTGSADFAISIGFPLIVIGTMLHPNSLMCRILEWRALRFVGRISYSLYLWQQLFFPNAHTPASWPFSILQQFPLNFFAAFVCAIGSYYLLEKPLIRVGHGLARKALSSREDARSRTGDPKPVQPRNELEPAA